MSLNKTDLQLNHIYSGFKLLKITKVPELHASTCYEFLHEQSGAKLLYVANEEDNKVFSISFRTTPKDDTGVAHIVEHSVLCGSRKFPTKEPFVELVKGSLNTFLNAMTFPDKTMYPVASCNEKDFRNLMDVYLDAVFYPNMIKNPFILKQEGWHFEIENPNEPLTYSGVVYNEMKGALSSPESVLARRMMNLLYPDTTYQYESGGDPVAIPELTQEGFTKFHQTYYHPSNSYIYLYGNMDILDNLKFINDEYLGNFHAITVNSEITDQKPFTTRQYYTEAYPISPEEKTENKTFLSLSYSIGSALDDKLISAFQILDSVLLGAEGAPLRLALIKAGLGNDVNSEFEQSIKQPVFSIVVNGSEADRAEKFEQVVNECLRDLVKNGIDKDLLAAAINEAEFKCREANTGTMPRGLIYNIALMNTWLYDGDPVTYLRYEESLATLKQWAKEGKFEELIQTYLLDNPHTVSLTLVPDKNLAAKKEETLKEKLANIKASMSADEIDNIIESTKQLKEQQRAIDSTEALATIPLLDIKDIKTTPNLYHVEQQTVDDVQTFVYPTDTNGVVYLQLLFNARVIGHEDLSYLHLLNELLGRVDTKHYTFGELYNNIHIHVGNISTSLQAFPNLNDIDAYQPKFIIKGKCLSSQIPKLVELMQEILLHSKFTNKERIRDLIIQIRTEFEMDILRNGHQIAKNELISSFYASEHYDNFGRLPYYEFIKNFADNFDEEYNKMLEAFNRILPKQMNTNKLMTLITAKAEDISTMNKELSGLYSALYHDEFAEYKVPFTPKTIDEGLISSTAVQYVFKGANFRRLGYYYTGAMKVLSTIMRYEYLWTNIRVLGGAYGNFVNFSANGVMFFGSYRDPHLTNTINVFDNAYDFIKNFDISDREMQKYVIGTISGMDTPLPPNMQGSTAFIRHIGNISDEFLQQERNAVLQVTQQDIRDLAELVKASMEQNNLCVVGSDVKINAAKDKFTSIKSLM